MRLGFFATMVSALLVALPCRADDVPGQIDSARSSYGKGDALRTLTALQSVVASLNARLSDQMIKFLPPPLTGWDAAAAETPILDGVGGGMNVTRSYSKDDATLTATLMVDNPAVDAQAAQFRGDAAAGAGWNKVKLGTEDALLRFDQSARSGELIIVIGGRALLQIEGTDIAGSDVLVELGKGWHVAGIRKLIGAGT
jgi:hypothetical protein